MVTIFGGGWGWVGGWVGILREEVGTLMEEGSPAPPPQMKLCLLFGG